MVDRRSHRRLPGQYLPGIWPTKATTGERTALGLLASLAPTVSFDQLGMEGNVFLKVIFILSGGFGGFLSGGLIAALLLATRENRTGFDGVAETAFAAIAGLVLGIVATYILSRTLSQRHLTLGIGIIFAISLLELIVLRLV